MSLIALPLEKALNRILHLDPDYPRLLRPLFGHSLKIVCTDLAGEWLVVPENDRLRIHGKSDLTASATLTGRSVDLLALAKSDQPQAILSGGKVSLSGDLKTLQAYQQFSEQLQLDWQGLIASVTNPTTASTLSGFFAKTASWLQETRQHNRQDCREFLQEEVRQFPPREAVEDFFADIQKLQCDLDRISAKLA